MAKSSATSGEKLTYQERRKQVIALRKGGASLRQIADRLQVSHETVRKDIEAVLAQLIADQQIDASAWRALELERLDALQLVVWTQATRLPPDYQAWDRMLKVLERRAKYLGLDAQKPAVNFQIDWDALTEEQLERIAAGEDPLTVVRS